VLGHAQVTLLFILAPFTKSNRTPQEVPANGSASTVPEDYVEARARDVSDVEEVAL
jgi:hypothetical protein